MLKWFPPTILYSHLLVPWHPLEKEGKMIWQTKSWPRLVMGKNLMGVDPVDLFFVGRGVQFTDVIWCLALLQLKIWRLFFCLWICFPILRILIRPWNRICMDMHKTMTWQKRETPSLKLPFWRACGMCLFFSGFKFRWEQYLSHSFFSTNMTMESAVMSTAYRLIGASPEKRCMQFPLFQC